MISPSPPSRNGPSKRRPVFAKDGAGERIGSPGARKSRWTRGDLPGSPGRERPGLPVVDPLRPGRAPDGLAERTGGRVRPGPAGVPPGPVSEPASPSGPGSAATAGPGRETIDLAVVVPVLDERENLPRLVERLAEVAATIGRFELDLVDDGSTDGTREYLGELAARPLPFDLAVLSRERSRGVLDAILAGAHATRRSFVLFMDADLQHPPEAIPAMWAAVSTGPAQVVVGSRHAPGGSVARLAWRGLLSRGAIALAHLLIPVTRRLADPVSGYFVASRMLVADLRPLPGRCKLLLYTLAMSGSVRVEEVPFRFEERAVGTSKLVGFDASFLLRYVIEVLTYAKIRPRNRPEFRRRLAAAGTPA